MIIVMLPEAKKEEIDEVIRRVKELGYSPHPIFGKERTVIAAVGDERGKYRLQILEALPGVDKVIPILSPYKLSSREFKKEDTVVKVGEAEFGGKEVVIIAGPCSVESRSQILEVAHAVKEAGAKMLRGGAFKPRTSPYSFQGLGEEGLELLKEASEETGLPVVTEALAPHDVKLVARYADMVQIGARNMQNYGLLQEVGKIKKPVLLKRGMMASLTELLMSAEYILANGNKNVVLCERGIRTFETLTRNTFDVSAIPVLKELSHLPVIGDPSHATGESKWVLPIARAAVAAGADGLMIEVHPDPPHALSDGKQSLRPEEFFKLVKEIREVAKAVGREV